MASIDSLLSITGYHVLTDYKSIQNFMSTTSENFQIKNYELTNCVFITTTNCAGIK